MKLGTIQYKRQPTAIIKGSDGNPRLLSKVCEASNLKPIHNLLDFIEGNNQTFVQCIEKINIDNFRSVARFHHLNDNWLDGIKVRGRFPRWKILKDDEQIAMWAPERGSFSLAKACVGILESCDSLKRISLKENLKWKGDVNLVNLESFDNTIRKGEYVLVMQGSQCLGLARASAPAWEWLATPGRLAKMHQRL